MSVNRPANGTPRRDSRPHIVVIGGGITGLVAAYRLTQCAPDAEITLLERDDRLGGKIMTEHIDGFIIEGGPEALLAAKPRGIELCWELGLGDRLVGANVAARRTYVMRDRRLHNLPDGLTGLVPARLGPLVRSPLISPRGKLRMALDYVQPPRRGEHDETVAAFVERRLGREAYERLIEPLVGGIYVADGRRLSLQATFPQLRQAEVEHGGLIRAARAGKRSNNRLYPAGTPPAPFLAPANGLAELVAALEQRLKAARVRIRMNVSASHLSADRAGGGYVVWNAEKRIASGDAVILATPAFVTADLVEPLDRVMADELRAIPYASVTTVSVAYPDADVPRLLDGHGYLSPCVEGRRVLACTWSSVKWPGRAPTGYALIRASLRQIDGDGAFSEADSALVDVVGAELREVLGITAPPILHRIFRWPRAMPQYVLGHRERVLTIERRVARYPGLALAGNAYHGIGLADCASSGEHAADTAIAALGVPDDQ